jgi:hypothetical protein
MCQSIKSGNLPSKSSVSACVAETLFFRQVDRLERLTGENIPVADYAKHGKPKQSWMIPRGCDKG